MIRWGLIRFKFIGFLWFLAATFHASMSAIAEPPRVSATELETEISQSLPKTVEFEYLKEQAERMGIRVWLFGGTASGLAHYAKWNIQRKKGDKRFQSERFDYDYTNIYRSTQDLDIVIDGTAEQAAELEKLLASKFSYTQGSKSAWEVRLLKSQRDNKIPLLDNPDFLNQHTDSNSTGMIEISDPPKSEPRIRDLKAWKPGQKNFFLDDVLESRLHFYFGKKHETTSRARAGMNPPILSVIRFLTKAFQYELTIRPEDLTTIKKIISEFRPGDIAKMSGYVGDWIERNGKKLVQNAVNIEYALKTLDELGLKSKLMKIKNDYTNVESLAWWLNKEALPSKPLGSRGRTAKELGITHVAHETNSFLSYESITRSHTGSPNALISRRNGAGEAAAYGDGFYTAIGRSGARGTLITIRFEVDPNAREGSDFTHSGNFVVFHNRNALRVIPETLQLSPMGYLQVLVEGNSAVLQEKALVEKLRRRLSAQTHALDPQEEREMGEFIWQQINRPGGEVIVKEWLNFATRIDPHFQNRFDHHTSASQQYEIISHITASGTRSPEVWNWVEKMTRSSDPELARRARMGILTGPSSLSRQFTNEAITKWFDVTTDTELEKCAPWVVKVVALANGTNEKFLSQQRLLRLAKLQNTELHDKAIETLMNDIPDSATTKSALAAIIGNDFSRAGEYALEPIAKNMEKLKRLGVRDGETAKPIIRALAYARQRANSKLAEALKKSLAELAFPQNEMNAAFFSLLDECNKGTISETGLRIQFSRIGIGLVNEHHPRFDEFVLSSVKFRNIPDIFSEVSKVKNPSPELVKELLEVVWTTQTNHSYTKTTWVPALEQLSKWKDRSRASLEVFIKLLGKYPGSDSEEKFANREAFSAFEKIGFDRQAVINMIFTNLSGLTPQNNQDIERIRIYIRAGRAVLKPTDSQYQELLNIAFQTHNSHLVLDLLDKVAQPKSELVANVLQFIRVTDGRHHYQRSFWEPALAAILKWKIKTPESLATLMTAVGRYPHGDNDTEHYRSKMKDAISQLNFTYEEMRNKYFEILADPKSLPDNENSNGRNPAVRIGHALLSPKDARLQEHLVQALKTSEARHAYVFLKNVSSPTPELVAEVNRILRTSEGRYAYQRMDWEMALEAFGRWQPNTPEVLATYVEIIGKYHASSETTVFQTNVERSLNQLKYSPQQISNEFFRIFDSEVKGHQPTTERLAEIIRSGLRLIPSSNPRFQEILVAGLPSHEAMACIQKFSEVQIPTPTLVKEVIKSLRSLEGRYSSSRPYWELQLESLVRWKINTPEVLNMLLINIGKHSADTSEERHYREKMSSALTQLGFTSESIRNAFYPLYDQTLATHGTNSNESSVVFRTGFHIIPITDSRFHEILATGLVSNEYQRALGLLSKIKFPSPSLENAVASFIEQTNGDYSLSNGEIALKAISKWKSKSQIVLVHLLSAIGNETRNSNGSYFRESILKQFQFLGFDYKDIHNSYFRRLANAQSKNPVDANELAAVIRIGNRVLSPTDPKFQEHLIAALTSTQMHEVFPLFAHVSNPTPELVAQLGRILPTTVGYSDVSMAKQVIEILTRFRARNVTALDGFIDLMTRSTSIGSEGKHGLYKLATRVRELGFTDLELSQHLWGRLNAVVNSGDKEKIDRELAAAALLMPVSDPRIEELRKLVEPSQDNTLERRIYWASPWPKPIQAVINGCAYLFKTLARK